jgi:hypothetical protein
LPQPKKQNIMSELIIKVEWYSPVEISYNGYRIMSQEDWNQLQELIKSDTQVPYTNTPKWWEESFPASELSDAFSIFSGPGAEHPGFGAPMTEEEHQNTLKSFRKLFPGGDVGDTSIIDSVFDAELNSGDGGDFEQMDEDGEEDEERKVLTREMAELALNDPNNKEELDFDSISSVETDAAELLSNYEGEYLRIYTKELNAKAADKFTKFQGKVLCFFGVTLTDDIAKSLSEFPGVLWVRCGSKYTEDGIKGITKKKSGELGLEIDFENVTPHTAKNLANCKASLTLIPSKLNFTNIDLAKALLKHEKKLIIDDVHYISPKVRDIISKFKYKINDMDPEEWVDSLESCGDLEQMDEDGEDEENKVLTKKIAKQLLSDKSVDEAGDFTSIEDSAAESLSKHKGEVCLSGLTELSDAAAKSFSKHKGMLWLGGLSELSDTAAESLSKHQGYLNLDGLTELGNAASLSNHQGGISLLGLIEISDSAAESLSKHQGDLWLNVGLWGTGPTKKTKLSEAAVKSLSKYQDAINGMDAEGWIESIKK